MPAITQLKQMAVGVANGLHMRALNSDKEDSEVSKDYVEAQLEHAKLAYSLTDIGGLGPHFSEPCGDARAPSIAWEFTERSPPDRCVPNRFGALLPRGA